MRTMKSRDGNEDKCLPFELLKNVGQQQTDGEANGSAKVLAWQRKANILII